MKVTVIIPAYNEEKIIKDVIDIVKKSKNVDEIIVVDNASTDSTKEIALKSGVTVVSCINKGKGYAMAEGIKSAKNEVLVFIDADCKYEENLIEKLSEPILNGEADFVKSTFNRTVGGVVTEVAVKPLLNILFPEMYKFGEPLSGMIAGKKEILSTLELETDYGVDIGILIDIYKRNAKIKEVSIGEIENLSHERKTNETMAIMSLQVMKAILKRK